MSIHTGVYPRACARTQRARVKWLAIDPEGYKRLHPIPPKKDSSRDDYSQALLDSKVDQARWARVERANVGRDS